MSATEALNIMRIIERAGVDAWVDGGWGIDALVGEQTRTHSDLDVVVNIEQTSLVISSLSRHGYSLVEDEDERPTRFVLRDEAGRSIDFHPVRFDAEGGGNQTLQDGRVFRYPPESFTTTGSIGGQPVGCISAETQVLCHLGYAPEADDIHDMCLLRDRLSVMLPHVYEC